MIRKFIALLVNRADFYQRIVNSNNRVNARRYTILRPDEYWHEEAGLVNALPWYLPFNAFLHCWTDGDTGYLHDHPRWSITIVLKGGIVEQTATKDKWLSPGSFVFRSHRFVHRMIVPDMYKGKTWTLFIVGRRKYRQSYYTLNGDFVGFYPSDVSYLREAQ